jgi:hypothetical protein
MTGSVAAKIFQIHGSPHSATDRRLARDLSCRVADLFDATGNGKTASGVLEHLGHEGHAFGRGSIVEGRHDLCG